MILQPGDLPAFNIAAAMWACARGYQWFCQIGRR